MRRLRELVGFRSFETYSRVRGRNIDVRDTGGRNSSAYSAVAASWAGLRRRSRVRAPILGCADDGSTPAPRRMILDGGGHLTHRRDALSGDAAGFAEVQRSVFERRGSFPSRDGTSYLIFVESDKAPITLAQFRTRGQHVVQ